MGNKKYFIISLFFLLLHYVNVNGQDPDFSQFYFNKLYFNPAFSGLSGGIEANLTDRVQWPNIPSKFNTKKFSANMDLSNIYGLGGAGIIAVSDIEGAGNLKTVKFELPVSARIKISKQWLLQGGASVAVIQKSINWDNFVFSDQFDNIYGIVRSSSFFIPNETKLVFPDFSAGFVFEYQHAPASNHQSSSFSTDQGLSFKMSGKNTWNVRFGFATSHLTQPDFSFVGGESVLPRKYVVHTDFIIPMNFDKTFVFAPEISFCRTLVSQISKCRCS